MNTCIETWKTYLHLAQTSRSVSLRPWHDDIYVAANATEAPSPERRDIFSSLSRTSEFHWLVFTFTEKSFSYFCIFLLSSIAHTHTKTHTHPPHTHKHIHTPHHLPCLPIWTKQGEKTLLHFFIVIRVWWQVQIWEEVFCMGAHISVIRPSLWASC